MKKSKKNTISEAIDKTARLLDTSIPKNKSYMTDAKGMLYPHQEADTEHGGLTKDELDKFKKEKEKDGVYDARTGKRENVNPIDFTEKSNGITKSDINRDSGKCCVKMAIHPLNAKYAIDQGIVDLINSDKTPKILVRTGSKFAQDLLKGCNIELISERLSYINVGYADNLTINNQGTGLYANIYFNYRTYMEKLQDCSLFLLVSTDKVETRINGGMPTTKMVRKARLLLDA